MRREEQPHFDIPFSMWKISKIFSSAPLLVSLLLFFFFFVDVGVKYLKEMPRSRRE